MLKKYIIWTKHLKLPVSFPFGKWIWHGIYGIQVGSYFIGVIKGSKVLND